MCEIDVLGCCCRLVYPLIACMTSLIFHIPLVALLWLLTAACIKTGRLFTAQKEIELAEQPLSKESIPDCAHVDVKGKRKSVEDLPSSSCASSLKKRRSIELVVDEDGDDGAETLDGGLQGGLNVYWVDIYAHFLERIEGIEEMQYPIVLQNAVDDVLIRHQHPIDTVKVYYSRWTSQVLDEISITDTLWEVFKTQVRGVHVYEPGENGEDVGE